MQNIKFIPSAHFWERVNFRILWPDCPHTFLTMPTQKNFWSAIYMQNINLFHLFILHIVNFTVLSPDWPHLFLTKLTQKFLKTFNLHEFVPAGKKSVNSVHSWDTISFRVQRPDWPHPFLTMPNQKVFNQLLLFLNFYQHAKNEAVWSICSREIVDLKTLQSDWLRAFWPISQKKGFFQI